MCHWLETIDSSGFRCWCYLSVGHAHQSPFRLWAFFAFFSDFVSHFMSRFDAIQSEFQVDSIVKWIATTTKKNTSNKHKTDFSFSSLFLVAMSMSRYHWFSFSLPFISIASFRFNFFFSHNILWFDCAYRFAWHLYSSSVLSTDEKMERKTVENCSLVVVVKGQFDVVIIDVSVRPACCSQFDSVKFSL